jgi:transcription elongation factor GreA-like protein
MAEVLERYGSDEEVLKCLEILGNEKVDNYHEEFIKKLYERYSQGQIIENMATHNPKLFLRFAKHWPHFLKNNALLA